MGRRKRNGNYSSQKKPTQYRDSVGNEEMDTQFLTSAKQ
jgi:hypothetical protein